MAKETDPDFEDLDALLREDTISSHKNIDSLGTGSDSPARDKQPAKSTHIDRLLARSTHISSNLRQACISICDTQNMVDIDREACVQLIAELENWDQAISYLEKAYDSLTIATADNKGQRIPHKENGGDLDPRDLMAKIAEQDAKIRELESRLNNRDSSIGKDITPGRTDTPMHDGTPEVSILKTTGQSLNRLIIATTDQGNLKFPLHKPIITIGRAPQNDIHIRSRFISRYHARIVCDEDGAIIEDLDSSNGVTVNSNRARRQPLRSGDLIDLGRTQLKYIDLTEGSSGEGQA